MFSFSLPQKICGWLLLVLALMAPTLSHAATNADPRLQDLVLGNANAPLTVIEYISLTCHHCADFNNKTMPRLKAEYVDTGKVRWIIRDLAMDGVGLQAGALARCLPREQFYPFVNVIFKQQANIIANPEPLKLVRQTARLAGLSEAQIEACIADTALLDGISQIRINAGEKYQINSTPTFIIGDDVSRLSGNQPYEKFKATLDGLLAKQK